MILALGDLPYRAEHQRSVERQFVQPKGLQALLEWYLHEWAMEVPDDVHVPGVWRDYVRWGEGRASVGGSAIGSPPFSDPFRRYTENSPAEVDDEGYYTRPIHRALVRMAGRNEGTPSFFMAHYLFVLALAHGNVDRAAAQFALPPGVVDVYTGEALRRLWDTWQPTI